jgi:uracil-DNA glycosylase
MKVNIESSWLEHLREEFDDPYFTSLTEFVRNEYATTEVTPRGSLIFNAFNLCPFDRVRVVMVGTDPYHHAGLADGLSYSVPEGVKIPPVLRNVFKELVSDVGVPFPASGDLTRWAVQGVLLLNTTLTVRVGWIGSHRNVGWERFTDAVILRLNELRPHVVYMLWGDRAMRKSLFIDRSKNLLLKSVFPSPQTADQGFFGSRPFSSANRYLAEHGYAPIIW